MALINHEIMAKSFYIDAIALQSHVSPAPCKLVVEVIDLDVVSIFSSIDRHTMASVCVTTAHDGAAAP